MSHRDAEARSLPEMSASQKPRLNPAGEGSEPGDSGILNERVLLLVLNSLQWDIHVLCHTAAVSRKLRAVAKRILWRELCVYRAARMIAALTNGGPNSRIGGGWQALAKLLFFCCGCASTRNFPVSHALPGHFVKASRFSKTSGRSFLTKKCRGDLLYVSDPCEHPGGSNGEEDLGIYRGVFRGFMKSRTRACLIARQVELEERVRCPYCGARVWSMTAAKLVPRTAAWRLGSRDGGLEFFVCLNGHMHGSCWLVPLSSDEAAAANTDDQDCSDHSEDDGGGPSGYGGADRTDTMTNGSMSSVDEFVAR
ncbi:EID1-like F-box protein 3 [Diospyros lotus]|uniref:EID1-like F-box protein 3 n=1 Tax=Diospyros lotus TaxID=55363 RepID=UPI00224DEBE1|nr:EID1-like F-box protein 3 [Diospyros lotus]